MIVLPNLPWEQDALEPYITKQTINFHYEKHHKGYVNNLNKLIKNTKFENATLEKIIIDSFSGPIFNNAAQVWNHIFYWNSLTPTSLFNETSEFGQALLSEFKSIHKFKIQFKESAKKLFGSGWVWTVKENNNLYIINTKNAETPLTSTAIPLFVCDVWEHAYYLDTQSDKLAYVDNFFKVINWKFAEENFNK